MTFVPEGNWHGSSCSHLALDVLRSRSEHRRDWSRRVIAVACDGTECVTFTKSWLPGQPNLSRIDGIDSTIAKIVSLSGCIGVVKYQHE